MRGMGRDLPDGGTLGSTAMPKPKLPPRQRILDAALAQFAARGVEGSSIQDVAARVRMSKQALMHHFSTKEKLRHGVYATLSDRLREVFPQVASELISRSHHRYKAIIEQLTHLLDAQPEIARFIAFELLDHPAELTAWLTAEFAPWLGLVVGVVQQHDGPSRKHVDPEAHVASIGLTMLAVSALMPRAEPKQHRRVLEAALQMMQLGSHLPGE